MRRILLRDNLTQELGNVASFTLPEPGQLSGLEICFTSNPRIRARGTYLLGEDGGSLIREDALALNFGR